MSQRRGIMTDQLDNVLQVIQLGRRTGSLLVERGNGMQQEEGEITFSLGQVTNARCGQLYGQAALTWLKTWKTCHYVFNNSTSDRVTGPIPEIHTSPSQRLHDTNPMLYSTPSSSSGSNWQRDPQHPRRTCSAEDGLYRIGQMRLSRHHRQLFLLLDGSRSFFELIRLTGRKPEEVQQLLRDLVNIGIVQSS